MAFLRNLLATLTGLVIFSIVGFFILIGIISAISASSEAVPDIPSTSVLHLNLNGVVVEKALDDPLQEILGRGPTPISLVDLLAAIEAAKDDDRIKGIYLEPKFLSAGSASLQEIRDAILDFKSTGKFVYAYGEYLSEGDYYLVSTADSIYLNPQGSLEFNGLTASVTFFKGLFDKLEIEPEIFRVGEFKSFVEPFIRKSMSDENRLQLSELINSVYSTYLQNVSDSRGIEVPRLKSVSDQMEIRFPEDAVKVGLISRVGYEDELIKSIKSKMELGESDKLKLTGIRKYMKANVGGNYSKNKIAVIVANGEIVMGEVDDAVGGEQFAREIREARESKSVKAIVLRVNSPGGSLTASDMIWREIMLTKGKKPIIASMSDVAASGGYYISMPCDTIVAQPNTITGSIGIFGMLFNFGKFLDNKLGITTDKVTTGEFSDLITVTRSLTPYERSIIQSQVEAGYNTFITKAAEGRGMTVEEIKKVAGGRVWTGEQAMDRGLVDMLGSLEDAITLAAEKADVADDYKVSYYPKQKPLMEKLLTELSGARSAYFSVETPVTPYLEDIRSLQRMTGLQARLPGNLEIN